MDLFRVAVAGAGRHGSRYIDHLINDIDEMEITGVLRSDPGKGLDDRWKPYSLQLFQSLDDLIRSKPDLLIIATPTDTHFDLAKKALSNGIDVLVEKPLCGNSEQCLGLLKYEKENEATITVAQTLRYSPAIKEMEGLLKECGPVRWFEVVNALEPPKTRWLLEKRAMGGCVLNTGVHSFDLVNLLLGRISAVTCWTESIFNPSWEDYAYGNLTLGDGTEGSFRFSRNTDLRTRYLRVDLQEGFIWADTLTDTIYNVKDGKMKKERATGERRTIIPLLNDMVKLLKGEIDNPIPSIAGFEAVAVAEACYASSSKDTEVRLKSIESMQ
jgi:predicted dehydrogenase